MLMIAPSENLPCSTSLLEGFDKGAFAAKPLYVNHACMTPVPKKVLAAMNSYYKSTPSCPLRHSANAAATKSEELQSSRMKVRDWLGARHTDEIIFTPNTTASINLVASSYRSQKGRVLLTDLEHNSNRLPWLNQGIDTVQWLPSEPFPLDEFAKKIKDGVKIVSITSCSNVTGASAPIKEIIQIAHNHGVPVHVDAAQEATHRTINVTEWNADYVSLSLHKTYGPHALGVLFCKREHQESLRPEYYGGGSVDDHFDTNIDYSKPPYRFEFGLQNYAGQYAAIETINFLKSFTPQSIKRHFFQLNKLATDLLSEIEGIHLIGPKDPKARGNIINFYIDGIDSIRLSELLFLVGGLHLRAGKFCANHYYHSHLIPNSIRISFGYHNTIKEVLKIVSIIKNIRRWHF